MDLLAAFEARLRARGVKDSTIGEYTKDVAVFFAFLYGTRRDPRVARSDDVRAWIAARRRAGYREATIYRSLSSLRVYYDGAGIPNPAREVTVPAPRYPSPPPDAARRLARLVTPARPRDAAIVRLHVAVGASAAVLARLRLVDVRERQSVCLPVDRSRRREFALDDTTASILVRYLEDERPALASRASGAEVFLGPRGALTRQAVWKVLRACTGESLPRRMRPGTLDPCLS